MRGPAYTVAELLEELQRQRTQHAAERAAWEANERRQLRDTFAAAALIGGLTRPAGELLYDDHAALAYDLAQSMVDERERRLQADATPPAPTGGAR